MTTQRNSSFHYNFINLIMKARLSFIYNETENNSEMAY